MKYIHPASLPEESAAEPPLCGATEKHGASEMELGQEVSPARHRIGKCDKVWTEKQSEYVIPELFKRSVWKEKYFLSLPAWFPDSYFYDLQQGNNQLRQIPFTPILKLLCSG